MTLAPIYTPRLTLRALTEHDLDVVWGRGLRQRSPPTRRCVPPSAPATRVHATIRPNNEASLFAASAPKRSAG